MAGHKLNVGTYCGMSIHILLLYVNIPLSVIIPPLFHMHLSPGASTCTVHQFIADLAYQALQSYSTTGPSYAGDILRSFMFFSFICDKFRFQTVRKECSLNFITLFKNDNDTI